MNELNEHLVRLDTMRGGFWAIDPAYVSLADLDRLGGQPGAIVRVKGNPRDHIAYFFDNGLEGDCIAGWVSEDV